MELTQQAVALADPPRWIRSSGLFAAGGAVVTGIVVAVAVDSAPSRNGLVAAVLALAVGTPIAVGIWLRHSTAFDRFARLLIILGFVWFPTTFTISTNPTLNSLGRVALWATAPVIFAVMLAFPSGRLTTRLDRAIVWASAALVVALYLPTVFLVDRYPVPGPQQLCGSDCPGNAFQLLDSQPGFIDAWLRPTREAISIVLFAAVVVSLARRYRGATRLMRIALAAPFAVIAVCSVAYVFAIAARWLDTQAFVPLAWVFVLTLPALAVAFCGGAIRSRFRVAKALERLAEGLVGSSTPDLRVVLARVLGDPTLVIGVRSRAGDMWVDPAGLPLELEGRATTEVEGIDGPLLLMYDAVLEQDPEFVTAAARFGMRTLECHELNDRLEAAVEETRFSRARMMASADAERRRLERDLHDGAQQRLIALSIRLATLAQLVESDPHQARARLEELAGDAQAALDEIRSLARGLYPASLIDGGLVVALEDVARRMPLPVTVEGDRDARYPSGVEVAMYFVCLEALQNVVKHAQGPRGATVRIRASRGVLVGEVVDDGAGFSEEDVVAGAGFANMQDRLATVGGRLSVATATGHGVRVRAFVPLDGLLMPARRYSVSTEPTVLDLPEVVERARAARAAACRLRPWTEP